MVSYEVLCQNENKNENSYLAMILSSLPDISQFRPHSVYRPGYRQGDFVIRRVLLIIIQLILWFTADRTR